MTKVKLKHVVIKNVGVVREGSRGRWVKVQIGRLGMTERDTLTNIIAKTVRYNSIKSIGGTIECVIWIYYYESFVSVGDIFYGDVEFSVAADGIMQAIELDSFTTDATATYSWEFPGDEETTVNRLSHVAIRFVKYTDASHAYAVFELGRVSNIELKELEKAYMRPSSPIYGDPTNGTIQKSEAYAHLYTVRLCLFIKGICEGKDLIEKVYDNSNVTITYTSTNVRPTLKSIEHRPCASVISWFGRHPVDWDRCVKEEIKTSTTTVFEAGGIVACNRDSSYLQIARLLPREQRDFDAFAGECGSKLNGRFDKLLIDGTAFSEEDRVLTNVSFAGDIEFEPGESICLEYIKIEKTGDEFKVVAAKRNTFENAIEEYGVAPAKKVASFVNVALKYERDLGGEWHIISIGRLSDREKESLQNLAENVTIGSALNGRFDKLLIDGTAPPWGDPTNGRVIFSEEPRDGLWEARLCVSASRKTLLEVDNVCNVCNLTLRSGLERLQLIRVEKKSNCGAFLRSPNWFEETKENCIELTGVVARYHGPSLGLQLGRCTISEYNRLKTFAGACGSGLMHGREELLTDESAWSGHDLILKNVSFADGLDVEFTVGESICLEYIKIKKTDNELTVCSAVRNTSENVEERWHVASAKQPEKCKKEFVNVAVRIAKRVRLHGYYILEIGRLTPCELDALQKIFRHTTHSNYDIISDETKGEVVSKKVLVSGECAPSPSPGGYGYYTAKYHMARICVYWPGCPLPEGTANDAAVITLESHQGNYRPTVKNIRSVDAPTNIVTEHWFDRFPFEAKDDDPIKIRLNGVFAVTITHAREYGGERVTVAFSLIQCMNYNQAVEDIGKALAIREGEPGRGIRWNPAMKLLEVTIQNENSDDISRIADAHSRLRMLELQYNPDNGAWGINMMHEFPYPAYHGGFVYANPSRRNGKTAELKRMLNAAYGMSIPEGADFDGDTMRYCMCDVAIQESLWRVQQKKSEEEETMKFGVPKIKQIIFNDPATVVMWEDGTKTVVHARDEEFDPEKGVAMAVARKALGNDREYYTYLQRHIKKGLRDSSGRKKESKPTGKKPAKKKGGKK